MIMLVNAHILEIRIHGPESPDVVHVGDALTFLAGVEKAVKACSTEEGAGLALVKIRKGSAKYGLRQIAIGAAAASLITYGLTSGDYSQLPADARVGLRDAIGVAKRMGWTAEIRWQETDEQPAATITPDTVPPSATATLTCYTTVYGAVEVVGGQTPGVAVRTDAGDRVRVTTTTEVAQVFGNHLYRPVRVTGEAEYRVEDMGIVRFAASAEIEPMQEASFASVMGELRGALADGWSTATVEEMMADLRGAEV
jgi:hypothetical protein